MTLRFRIEYIGAAGWYLTAVGTGGCVRIERFENEQQAQAIADTLNRALRC